MEDAPSREEACDDGAVDADAAAPIDVIEIEDDTPAILVPDVEYKRQKIRERALVRDFTIRRQVVKWMEELVRDEGFKEGHNGTITKTVDVFHKVFTQKKREVCLPHVVNRGAKP